MSKPNVNKWAIEVHTKAQVSVPIGDGEFMYHEISIVTDDSIWDIVDAFLEDKYEITE